MKQLLERSAAILCILSAFHLPLMAQYYFTGEVKGQHGDKLPGVLVTVQTTGAGYRTGTYGDFGITSDRPEDSLIFSFNGYESYKTAVRASGFLQVVLTPLAFNAGPVRDHLLSVFSDSKVMDSLPGIAEMEGSSLVENPFVVGPSTVSFSTHIERASYRTIKRFLDMGTIVPPDAVKIEELLHYFDFFYEGPEEKGVFTCMSDLQSCPWNTVDKVLYLDICARKVDIESAPIANLVFLIDASGSMDMPDRLPLAQSTLRSLVRNLRDRDTVSIVAYGGRTGVVVAGVPGSEKNFLTGAFESLQADGATAAEAGIRLAYEVAQRQFIPGGNNRIILITDGDIHEGGRPRGELEELVDQGNKAGIHLSCVGVGPEAIDNSQLATLAQWGQGNFIYMGQDSSAEEQLIKELAPASFTVAENTSVTAAFNPLLVKGYRLIGFDNRKKAIKDTTLHLEGNKICSAHSLLALFEIAPRADTTGADTIAEIKVRYHLPGQSTERTLSYYPLLNSRKTAEAQTASAAATKDQLAAHWKRAAVITLFGMKLKDHGDAAFVSWADLERMTRRVFAGNAPLDREYIAMVSHARKIYEKRKN